MRDPKAVPNFSDRKGAAEAAKNAAIERFRTRPGPDDPAVAARRAASVAIAEARDIRGAERLAAREAEAVRLAAERAAEAAAQVARDAEARRLAAEAAAQAVALKAEQKAARDGRYAARKARR
jgi:hypothetical protein